MKLQEYRKSISKEVKECADEIGVSDVIWRQWESGEKTPGRDNKKKLFEWSKGAVTPNDFYEFMQLHNTG